jgi:deoxycytidylate deaminase
MTSTLKQTALKMSCNGQHRQHRIGAVISYRGKLYSRGWNKSKTHPKSPHPYKYIHAEMDAIFKNPPPPGSEIFVARIDRNGRLAIAKPCAYCAALLTAYGVHKVHYTADGGWKVMEL